MYIMKREKEEEWIDSKGKKVIKTKKSFNSRMGKGKGKYKSTEKRYKRDEIIYKRCRKC